MSHQGPVAVVANPHDKIREHFRALAGRIAQAKTPLEPLKKAIAEAKAIAESEAKAKTKPDAKIEAKEIITAKDFGHALKEATQYCNSDLISYFLEQCENIAFEDILTAFEMAIMTDNKKITSPFSKHLASRQSPRTGNDKKEHTDTIKALNLANGDLALLADKDLSAFSLRKALGIAAMAGNGRVFKPILEHAKTNAEDKTFAFHKAVQAGQTHIVKMILQNGAISDLDLGLALESACESSRMPIALVILEHNAEPISDGSFGNALGKVLESPQINIDLLKLILEKGGKKIPQNVVEEASNLAALRRVEVFKLLLPFNTALTETQRTLWLFAIADAEKFKPLIQSPALTAKDRIFALQKVALSTKSDLVKSTLLEIGKKDEVDPVILGKVLRKACKRINAANFEVIQALYESCKKDIPLEKAQKALLKMIDSDRYHHDTFAFMVKSHDKNFPASFLEEAIDKSVRKGRSNALDVLLNVNNMSPRQRKTAIVAAFEANKQEMFNDSRFSMMDRIRAIGLSAYLLKISEDMKTTRPLLAKITQFGGRLIAAISTTWNEPKPVKAASKETSLPPATLSPRGNTTKEATVLFSSNLKLGKSTNETSVIFSPDLKPAKSTLKKPVESATATESRNLSLESRLGK